MKWVAAYFASFAALGAVVLGVAAVAVWQRASPSRAARALTLAALVAGLTVSVVFIRHPLLPVPRPRLFADDAIRRLDVVTRQLHTLVPAGARVFFFGQNTPVYLAGFSAPPQQMLSAMGTFVAHRDGYAVARNGGWGRAELERWLGFEFDWALVTPAARPASQGPHVDAALDRMQALLEQHFVRVGRVGTPPYFVYDVYQRRR